MKSAIQSDSITIHRRSIAAGLLALSLLALGAPSARASIAYGSINNFDTVNDTGVECHGFEIEIDDIRSADISYTYDWNHYGTPKITEDNSDPLHPKVFIRYESAKNPDGSWAAYTAIPSGPIAPTDGHMFTDPSVNFGGEHFGVGYNVAPGNIYYHWLVDNGSGVLVRGAQVSIGTPTFTYAPPVAAVPAQVQAVIKAPPMPVLPVYEFGPASWVKEIRTTTHNNGEVKLRDLVSDDPDKPDDKNWRNGEPDEVEVEWQILQTDYNKADGGVNGELKAAAEALPGGDEVVTRRYEFYRYVGPIDFETHEAMAENVGPDGIHGVGIKIVNGVEVDLSTVEIVGEYLGAQMSAFDAAPGVGLIEHVQDGALYEPYPTRTVVIAGQGPFTAVLSGSLPAGITFDAISGQLSGTPFEAGVFTFTIDAVSEGTPPVRRTYTLTVSDAGVDLLPRGTVDTLPSPLNAGVTTGDGSYVINSPVTVTAIPADGYVFSVWTDNGKIVSTDPNYTFTNSVNRSLVANFIPAGPKLSHSMPDAAHIEFLWPTNAAGYVLQMNTDLGTTNWVTVSAVPALAGTNRLITLSPTDMPRAFFRLFKP